MPILTTANRTQLRNDLSKYFSADELDTLCTDLGEDYDVVPGRNEGELVRAREIVAYFEERNRIDELIMWCVKQRPDVNWQARLMPDSAFTNTARRAGQPKLSRSRVPSILFTIIILVLICAGIVLVGGIFNALRQASQPAMPPVTRNTASPSPTMVANATSTALPATSAATDTPESTSAVAPIVPPPAPTNTPAAPPAINISNSAGRSEKPRVAVDADGITHVFWIDNTLRRANGSDVLHRERRPNGSWSNFDNFTEGFESVLGYNLQILKAPSGDLCVFFEGQNDVIKAQTNGLYMRCKSAGAWQPPQFIQQIRGGGWVPAFAPDGSVHVMRLIPGGYCPVVDGTDLSDGFGACSNQIFLIDAANHYHVAWVQSEKPGPYSVRYRLSTDGGKIWQAEQKLSDETSVPGINLRGVLDRQGRLTFMWAGFFLPTHYRQWTQDAGWGSILSLKEARISSPQDLTVDQANYIHGVETNGLSHLLYFAQQADGQWGRREIDDKTESLGNMSIALDAQDGRHIVWTRDGDIFYAYLPAGQ